ncbi:MAG: thioester oxidase [Bacteroides sp. SM23_62_1]|nr:MAG: thioester oxidase [Bacteroides sp. SM23_62_1]
MQRPTIGQLRYFLKDSIRKTINFGHTDQSRGVPAPPIQKPYETGVQLITLSDFDKITCLNEISLNQAIIKRRSQRSYKSESLSLEEISYLLYVTQGIRIKISDNVALRTVPSAGARHPFETYICATHIRDLQQGIYRYLPVEHKLFLHRSESNLKSRLTHAAFGQDFVGNAPAVFIWTTIPYRMEWRYGEAAHKAILLDAGHVCQNLYLAVQDISCGTCAVAAYDQEAMDQLLDLNTEEEFVIYLAPVGKI